MSAKLKHVDDPAGRRPGRRRLSRQGGERDRHGGERERRRDAGRGGRAALSASRRETDCVSSDLGIDRLEREMVC